MSSVARMSIVSSVVPRCTLGAPRSSGARLVVAKRHGASRVLYTVLPKDVHERPRFAPWLGDIEDQLADNAVSEVDVFTYYDDEQPDDGARNVLAAVNTVLPVAGDDSPEDTWGEHVLVDAEREIWVSWSIGTARRKAQALGLEMSEAALQRAADKAYAGHVERRRRHDDAMLRRPGGHPHSLWRPHSWPRPPDSQEEQEAQEDHNAAETAESDAAARSFA